MDRRNFLAIIPSLGALPFMATDIVKSENKIEIFQPEQVEDAIKLESFHWSNVEVTLSCGHTIIGKGMLTELEMRCGGISDICIRETPDSWSIRAAGMGPLHFSDLKF